MATSKRPLWVWLVGGVVAAGLGFWAWDDLVKPATVIKRFGVVEEGKVYRSGELTPASLSKIVRERGIRTEVDLGTFRDDPAGEARMAKAATALGVTRYSFHLYGDASGDPNEYLQALRLINDPANQPVLVHCGAGTHRTGCAVVLYRTIVQGKDYQASLREAEEFDYLPEKHVMVKQMLDQWREPIAKAMKSGTALVERTTPHAETVANPAPTTIQSVPETKR
ncbi:MAG: tyrosine-protein phosphatase [Planctomycetes bacterium]|nr:tyrosine-protein phosphatase [Planctomycetota bacterium]